MSYGYLLTTVVCGRLPEWLNGAVSKTVKLARASEVRILHLPPEIIFGAGRILLSPPLKAVNSS